jgi:hypothetical protein
VNEAQFLEFCHIRSLTARTTIQAILGSAAVRLETPHLGTVMSEQRNKMVGSEALGPTHIIGHRLKAPQTRNEK